MERLQKFLSKCGIASRRKSEKLILDGKIKVNGIIVNTLGYKVSDSDVVCVEEVEVKKEEKVYFLLYKPEGIICSVKDEKGRSTVIDLIDTKEKIFPVGRLDYDTSGLLLLTNDGELTNKLTHPSHDIEKVYSAKIEGYLSLEEIKKIENGIVLDGIKTKKAKVKVKKIDKKSNKSVVEITITEGRNHQIKNILAYFNHKVIKLKRIRYSFLDLDNMKKGEYRPLSIKEIKKLYNDANKN